MRVRRIVPTAKQIKAVQFRTEGMSKRQALIKAGYSLATAHNASRIFKKKGMQYLLENFKEEITEAGVTTKLMAEKFAEWIQAQKIHSSPTEPDMSVPDYDIQLKAFKEWKGIMYDGAQPKGVKRRMTIEEFIGEEDQQS